MIITAASSSHFGLNNLPYGIYSTPGRPPRAATRLGDYIIDLASLLDDAIFAEPTLNPFLAQGRSRWQEVRRSIRDALEHDITTTVFPVEDVKLHLPITIGDYVDFYASEHHATNLGRILRPDQPALPRNWKHLPIGYHGRSGTVIVSGEDIPRPSGQYLNPETKQPEFGPTQRLDFEVELGFVIGISSIRGIPVTPQQFEEYVFGAVIVNDWSARDLQSWEYVPLGPFLGKSFATSLAPWIVPIEALEHARLTLPTQTPPPLRYLRQGDLPGLAIDFDVTLNSTQISTPSYAQMYWSPAQMLAHMTINGASVRTGDLFASGTVSGSGDNERGSLIELTWNGQQPVQIGDAMRSFLEDGDTLSISASAPGPTGCRIGFGEVTARIGPASAPGLAGI